MSLTDAKVKAAKATGKRYPLSDGHGLHLEVDPEGRKYWNWVYYWPLSGKETKQKQRTLRIGAYPLISLRQAREERAKWAEIRRSGQDPREVKATRVGQSSDSASRFEVVAREWFELERPRWSERHIKDQEGKLKLHVLPALGDKNVNEIRVAHAELMLRPLNTAGKGETAKRCMTIACAVMDFAVIKELVQANPLSPAKRALPIKHEKKHHPTLKWEEVSKLWQDISRHQGKIEIQTHNALRLQALTFQRPGELIAMRWEEIDWDKRRWMIPAVRMKRSKDHIVPLSTMALAVLKHQQKITGKGSYVFASNRSKKYGHISNGTMNRALNSMGYQGKLCPHGFRAMAMTALQEEKGVERIHIDRQLAHVPETKVAAAYNRAEYISSRTDLMEVWGEMLKEAGMTLPE